jgi:tetratricopeptide (TPR) repeat protein
VAQACHWQALALHRQAGSREGEADTLNGLSEVYRDAGRYRRAKTYAQAGLAQATAANDHRLQADSLNLLATIHQGRGDQPAAAQHHHEALRLAQDGGYQRGEITALIGLAVVDLHLRRHQRALTGIRTALGTARRRGLRVLEGQARTVMARIHLNAGNGARCAAHCRAALRIHAATGHHPGILGTRNIARLARGEATRRIRQPRTIRLPRRATR